MNTFGVIYGFCLESCGQMNRLHLVRVKVNIQSSLKQVCLTPNYFGSKKKKNQWDAHAKAIGGEISLDRKTISANHKADSQVKLLLSVTQVQNQKQSVNLESCQSKYSDT